jgi:predicted XRE-type DNA-binding protein
LDIYKPHEVTLPKIKNQVNRRFLQAGMAELLKVARSEISDSVQERKQNGHNSIIWAPIKMNEYPLEK